MHNYCHRGYTCALEVCQLFRQKLPPDQFLQKIISNQVISCIHILAGHADLLQTDLIVMHAILTTACGLFVCLSVRRLSVSHYVCLSVFS